MISELLVEHMMGESVSCVFFLMHTMFVVHIMYMCLIFLYICCSAIKVWDFQAALDPRTPADALCLRTLVVRGFL